MKFPGYRGLTVTLKFPINNFNGLSFVTGLGTSDANITGKTFGSIFPEYGAKNTTCSNPQNVSTKCQGKGFMYVLEYLPPGDDNAGGFESTAVIHVTNTRPFPGTTECAESALDYSGHGQWMWRDLGEAKPHDGTVTFKSFPFIINMAPGVFEVYAFHCW